MPVILVEVEMAHVIQSKPYIFSVVDRENIKKSSFSVKNVKAEMV